MDDVNERIPIAEDLAATAIPTPMNPEVPEQNQNTEPGQDSHQVLIDHLKAQFSTEGADMQIEELRSTSISPELLNTNQIEEAELVEKIKIVLVATESYRENAMEKYVLGVIDIGILAYSLKQKVEVDPDINWTTYAKEAFGDIIKLRTLQIYIRFSRFKDCKSLAFTGTKTLDKLISKIKAADGSADEIRPYLEENGLETGLDFTNIEARKVIKDKINELLKKTSPSPAKTEEEKQKEACEKFKNQIISFNRLYVPLLAPLNQEERDDLLKIMEAAVDNVKNAPQTNEDHVVEEQLDPPAA